MYPHPANLTTLPVAGSDGRKPGLPVLAQDTDPALAPVPEGLALPMSDGLPGGLHPAHLDGGGSHLMTFPMDSLDGPLHGFVSANTGQVDKPHAGVAEAERLEGGSRLEGQVATGKDPGSASLQGKEQHGSWSSLLLEGAGDSDFMVDSVDFD